MVVITKNQFPRDLLVVADRFSALRRRIDGKVLTAGDPDYDHARRMASFRGNRFPAAIVQVENANDVATAVTYAREHGLPLSVRSGGHSIALFSVIDDALVVDLSRMKQIVIEPERAIAHVQAGATSGDLAGPAHEHGLALSTGDTQSVGMGGLTTGGGIGYLVRNHGLAIDSLVSAQVVTANGEIVTASDTEHPDLFWAIRGGGGNFGIVTEFTYQLAPVGDVLGGVIMLPASHEVIRGYLDCAIAAPDELTMLADLTLAPPAPFVPEDRVGEQVLSILLVWSGDAEAGQRALEPVRALATPIADTVAWIPYPQIYAYTAHLTQPHAASIRMMFADDLSDGAIDAMLAASAQPSSPFSLIQLRGLGGAYARVANEATAFAHRDRRYFVSIIGVWLDPEEDATPHEAWTSALWDVVRPEGSGVYVNFLEAEGPDRVREAYPGDTYDRLATIKQQYDPENVFRFNQNIPPQA